MTITFFGHRNTNQSMQSLLKVVLKDLIENKDADVFYVGNQGNFDDMVRNTLIQLKNDYPYIRYYVVLAYMPIKREGVTFEDYADTIFPEGLENTPRRYAISKRNRWMIEQADTVVTYVIYKTGGATQFKELAEKKGKCVINLADLI